MGNYSWLDAPKTISISSDLVYVPIRGPVTSNCEFITLELNKVRPFQSMGVYDKNPQFSTSMEKFV